MTLASDQSVLVRAPQGGLVSRVLWPAFVLVTSVLAGLAILRHVGQPVQEVSAFWLFLVCPGAALVGLLRLADWLVALTLAVACSLAIDMVVAEILLYGTWWSMRTCVVVLVAITLVATMMRVIPVPASALPQMPDTRWSQEQVSGSAARHESHTARLIVSAALVLLAVFGGVVAFMSGRVQLNLGASPTHTASAPAPARSWRFPALSGGVDQAVVTFSNPGHKAATVRVSTSGTTQRVRLQMQSESEMELAPNKRVLPITVTSTVPIVVERIVVRGGKTYTSYGLHR